MQVCRICLTTDRKMYSLDSDRIRSYEQITGVTFVSNDLLPKYVCWECGYYMSKYVAFKSKAVMSQSILEGILSSGGLITQKTIGSIKRKEFKFHSALTNTDVSYLCVVEEEKENHLDIDTDIKSEHDDNNKHFVNLKDHFADDSIDDIQDFHEMLANPTREIKDDEKSYGQSSNKKSYGTRKRKSTAFEIDITSDIDSTDSIKDNKNIDKPANQPYVKKKRKNRKAKDVKASKKPKEINRKSQKVFVNEKRAKKDDVSVLDKIDKNILNLTKLSLDEQAAEVEKRKLNDNYRKSKFKCTFCFRGFLDDEKLNRHMEKHSESQGAYECQLCKLRYVAQCKLNLHMKTHLYRISCLQCDFSTSTLNVAIKHQNHHKGKQFVCPHCKEIYTHASSYLSHLRIKHPSNVICQHCGHSFINARGLLIHKKCVHRFDQTPIPEDGPHCAKCDIRFACQRALETHRQLSGRHAGERNSPDEREQRRKATKCRSRPTSEPFAEGPRPCEQCNVELASARAYFEHFRKEHRDKNRTLFYAKKAQRCMCEVCGKMLQSTANLRDHQYAHSESKQFKCERCGRLFQLSAHLRLHQRHHCGARTPYPCAVCGKVFTNQSNLQRHMVSHTGIKAHKCEMCDKTFAHLGNKRVHVEFVHKKKPWPKRNRGARTRAERQQAGAGSLQQSARDASDSHQQWGGARDAT